MKTEEVFTKRIEIDYETSQAKNKLHILKIHRDALQFECNHDLVLKFDTHQSHLVGKIYPCICPACKKMIDIGPGVIEIENTVFKDSKVIDLTDILEYHIILDSAINIVSNRRNYFYDDKVDTNDLAKVIKGNIKK